MHAALTPRPPLPSLSHKAVRRARDGAFLPLGNEASKWAGEALGIRTHPRALLAPVPASHPIRPLGGRRDGLLASIIKPP